MSEVTIDEFKKLELRVAKVLAVEEIPGADRLWKLTVDTGQDKREVVAGVKSFYSADQLLGRSVVIVQNLVPAKIRGVESRGMILAAKDASNLCVLTLDKELPAGSIVG